MGCCCGKIEVADVLYGSTETDCALHVGRTRLEALGRGGEGGFFESHFIDHIAPALVWGHIGE